MELDWEKIAPEIAVQILGEPSKKDGSYYRWGSKGSLALNLEQGTFFDFENNQGYGLIEFIKNRGLDPDDFLKEYKPLEKLPPNKPSKPVRKYTDKDMFRFKEEAEIFVRYSESFCVMRFPEGHAIKQKYAPFHKVNNEWLMRRPEGKLPIYVSDRKPTEPVVIVEGEKAMLGGEAIYDGDICCHHGGVSNWQNCDWSALKDRKVYIFPDNDEQGKKMSSDLQVHLKDICTFVEVVKIPRQFKEKDDLWDAHIREHWTSSAGFIEYCQKNTIRNRVSLELLPIGKMLENIQKPNWLIENVLQKETVVALFGAPKAGKSFVAVDISSAIATGQEWHGQYVSQHPVVYLAGEGVMNISKRFLAYGGVHERDVNNMPLLMSSRGARLLDDKDHQLLKDTIYEAEDVYGDIGLIVVDTLARNFGGGNENSTEDMNAFIERIDDLKDTFKSTILIVHHTGHGLQNRTRGSSVLPAAVDGEFRVNRTDNEEEMFVKLSQTLVKDGKPLKDKNFKFQIYVDTVRDITSGALIETDEIPVERKNNLNDDKVLSAIKMVQNADEEPQYKWVQRKEIENITEINKNTLAKILRKLVEEGKLEKSPQGGYQYVDTNKDYDLEDFKD
jgi:5S rRNA maturation endonuclease (ribonuclease M5)